MSFLFRFFLLFCSREFITFYGELRRQDRVNSDVLAIYMANFARWMGLYLFVVGVFYYNAWQFYLAPENPWVRGGGLFVLVFFFGLFLWPRIKALEKTAFAYSDGALAEGRVFDKDSYRKTRILKYAYKVDGKVFTFQRAGQSLLDFIRRKQGEEATVIYAQSAPNVAVIFDPDLFAKRCLDRDKALPLNQKN
ncbi:MAG: hypothetical protein V7776_12310 [Halopseudomonas aestusnigri]